jgi:uncharacterized protein YaiE (UPF0345 family)
MWNWLFGQPCEVSAQLGYGQYSDIKVDDKASLFFRHENGMWGAFISSSGDSPGTNRLEIHGELGRLVVEDDRFLTIYRNEDSTTQVSKTSEEMYAKIPYTAERREVAQAESEYTIMLRNFADAMEGRAKPLATLSDGKLQRGLSVGLAAEKDDGSLRPGNIQYGTAKENTGRVIGSACISDTQNCAKWKNIHLICRYYSIPALSFFGNTEHTGEKSIKISLLFVIHFLV